MIIPENLKNNVFESCKQDEALKDRTTHYFCTECGLEVTAINTELPNEVCPECGEFFIKTTEASEAVAIRKFMSID